ncbi:unnamed protein product [Chrysodeixis includens]|uniref:Uncharacterized protein n=1 Tax=Chrysodeixis includens TaxID=689277 RepID=A0A9N8L485_CHRIL|nr:unnamed protein product [Chrysodeixis includens]
MATTFVARYCFPRNGSSNLLSIGCIVPHKEYRSPGNSMSQSFHIVFGVLRSKPKSFIAIILDHGTSGILSQYIFSSTRGFILLRLKYGVLGLSSGLNSGLSL